MRLRTLLLTLTGVLAMGSAVEAQGRDDVTRPDSALSSGGGQPAQQTPGSESAGGSGPPPQRGKSRTGETFLRMQSGYSSYGSMNSGFAEAPGRSGSAPGQMKKSGGGGAKGKKHKR